MSALPQVRISLPPKVYRHICLIAADFDITVTSYIRELIMADIRNELRPVRKVILQPDTPDYFLDKDMNWKKRHRPKLDLNQDFDF